MLQKIFQKGASFHERIFEAGKGGLSAFFCFVYCGGKEEPVLKKLSVCVLFGGVSSEHEVSLRSAESVLNRLDKDRHFAVG